MEELKKVIFSLKSNKNPGIDGLTGEIFKSSYDILSPFLLRLFNVVFSSGCYPTQWSEGLITPIHKKGSLDDVNNYRGIALINILSKIYSHLLNNRLLKWAEQNEKLSDCQFGFQRNKSTVDCIFIFHALISKILSNSEKLYCCFIDYQKAFDLVNRGFLWKKLIRNECSSKMILALQAMYKSVKACVRYKNRCSSYFDIHAGVKQGDPLSPVLFILFINDILDSLANENDATLAIDEMNLFMLLYADDAVLFSKSAETLQNMLNRLHTYSSIWGLKVNTEKTKIMIFEKGPKTYIDIFYNDILLEVVDSFKYLGTMFFKNGSWNRTQKYIADYALFALHKLNKLFQNITLPDSEKFKLFDCLVGSVLSYSSEVWGFHKAPDIERVHTRFCRSLLGVKKSTNLSAIYCELGRKPLALFRKLRIIRYWMNLIHTDNSLLRDTYNMLRDDAMNNNSYAGSNWAYNVKTMLDNLGLSFLWDNQDIIDKSQYSVIKTQLFDNATQELLTSINISDKLDTYSSFKYDTEYEPYLKFINNKKYKFALSRLRLSSHGLAVETGRYNRNPRIPRANRLCLRCNMRMVEDEYHFLLVCPLYADIRRKYLAPYYCRWPSVNKFKSLMKSTNRKTLINLSKCIYHANCRRQSPN